VGIPQLTKVVARVIRTESANVISSGGHFDVADLSGLAIKFIKLALLLFDPREEQL
jgi:hypothetical protein